MMRNYKLHVVSTGSEIRLAKELLLSLQTLPLN
jgi:hypothetical protein